MNKNELITAVANSAKLSKSDAARAVEAMINTIGTSLKKGNDVRLVGFGTFLIQKRKATTGRNPRTGAKINIPASRQPKFRAGKALKKSVN
jgi:DNA-binding protein HU-beta